MSEKVKVTEKVTGPKVTIPEKIAIQIPAKATIPEKIAIPEKGINPKQVPIPIRKEATNPQKLTNPEKDSSDKKPKGDKEPRSENKDIRKESHQVIVDTLPSETKLEKPCSASYKNITRILIFQVVNLAIGLCILGLFYPAWQDDKDWTLSLTKHKLELIGAEISDENDTMNAAKIETIKELANRNHVPPLVALILIVFTDVVLLLHMIIYFFHTAENYRVYFGRLLNVFIAMLYVVILVIVMESMLRINEDYYKLYTMYVESSVKSKTAKFLPHFSHCTVPNSEEGSKAEIKREKMCQDGDAKIIVIVFSGLKIIFHGGVAVLSKSKQMILADRIDNAPDLLYDTYDTKYIRINLSFDELHTAHGHKVFGSAPAKSTYHFRKPTLHEEELRFGNLTFGVVDGELIDNSPPTTNPSFMPEFEPVDGKILRLVQQAATQEANKAAMQEANKLQKAKDSKPLPPKDAPAKGKK